MPEEHDKPIEHLLNAYAQRRREEAGEPLELHPATRRLLQGEVRRRFDSPEGKARGTAWQWLVTFWPRLAFGGGLVAVLAMVLILWNPRDAGFELADTKSPVEPERALDDRRAEPAVPDLARLRVQQKQEKESSAPPSADNIPSLVPRPQEPPIGQETKSAPQEENAPAVTAGRGLMTEGREESVRQGEARPEDALVRRDEPEVRLNPSPPPASTPITEQDEASATLAAPRQSLQAAAPTSLALRSRPADPTSPPLASSAEATPSVEFFFQLTSLETNTVSAALGEEAGRSRRMSRHPLNVRPVLTTFRLVRNGQAIRVIDQDQSVYTGSILSSNAMVAGEPVAEEQLTRYGLNVRPVSEEPPSEDAFSFMVTGTNRTLNRQVSFTGVYSPADGVAAASRPGSAARFARPSDGERGRSYEAGVRIQGTEAAGRLSVDGVSALTNGPGSIQGTIQLNGTAEIPVNAIQLVEPPR